MTTMITLTAEHEERFNERDGDYYYNRRRVWTNGARKLEIYYTMRFTPGRWVISNGSYHLIVDFDQLNDGGLDGGSNNSFPGLFGCTFNEITKCRIRSMFLYGFSR